MEHTQADNYSSKWRMKAALYTLLLAYGFGISPVHARQNFHEKPDSILQEQLEAQLENFRGEAGVYVKHLPSGRTAAIRADELFPTASLVKVPILLALFDKIEHGELEYDTELTYLDTTIYAGDTGIVASLKDSTTIALSKLAMLMITTSDNSASLWCQSLAGTGSEINRWLAANGFEHSRVNSRTPGRQEAFKAYGWGQTTPREMAEMLVMIRQGQAVSPAASEEMYRVLTRIYWNSEALSEIPPFVQAASKQGAISHSRSEVVLVNAPSGDYVFCLITKNQTDKSWAYENDGFVLLRQISRMLWRYFEPDAAWEPAAGRQKWIK